jgi:hypothetical protein
LICVKLPQGRWTKMMLNGAISNVSWKTFKYDSYCPLDGLVVLGQVRVKVGRGVFGAFLQKGFQGDHLTQRSSLLDISNQVFLAL